MKTQLALYCCLGLLLANAGAVWHTVHAAQDLSVTAGFIAEQPVTPDEAIFLRLNRSLTLGEGRVGVVIGSTDVSSLFAEMDGKFVYDPKVLPLPLGASIITAYLVRPDGVWQELARFPLQVVKEKPPPTPTPEATPQPTVTASVTPPPDAVAQPAASPTPDTPKSDIPKLNLIPSVTIGVKSQPFLRFFPDDNRPSRTNFSDFTLQIGLRAEMNGSLIKGSTQVDIAGSSFRQEALRAGTLGDAAPQVDLSSYLMEYQIGRAKVNLGHTSFGTLRHLMSNFSSRGLTVTIPFLKRFDFSAGALNGTSIVGYNNLAGLARARHQMQGGTLGVELFTKRPGGLRLEVGGFNGYFQALNGFAQGSVNDAERSKGGAARVIFADKSQRLKAEAGFTRSSFQNPADALLDQGANVVSVPRIIRNARYLEGTADALRNFKITNTRALNLTLGFRHERVEPLFKSLAASTQADKTQNEWQLNAALGEITLNASHVRFNDNLKPIPSILRSLTRATQFAVGLPVATFFKPSPLLPRLSYSFSRNHVFGAGIPVNGGFEVALDAIPNQFSTNQSLGADWQFPKLAVGYSYNRSFTNNQQTGRELADLLNQTHGFRVGFTPLQTFSLNFDLSRDGANNKEINRLDGTWRAAFGMNWQLNKRATLGGNISHTLAGDKARTSRNRNFEFDAQFTYSLGVERGELKKVKTQLFVRYANRFARSRDNVFLTNSFNKQQTLNTGLSITFF